MVRKKPIILKKGDLRGLKEGVRGVVRVCEEIRLGGGTRG